MAEKALNRKDGTLRGVEATAYGEGWAGTPFKVTGYPTLGEDFAIQVEYNDTKFEITLTQNAVDRIADSIVDFADKRYIKNHPFSEEPQWSFTELGEY